ncbi:ABC transporter permease [Nocardia grenadensis]|uniref:ABC transporter permease n=1 Tax=Nocardia grenadensis TaxID=931537 RepID=UPI003D76256F
MIRTATAPARSGTAEVPHVPPTRKVGRAAARKRRTGRERLVSAAGKLAALAVALVVWHLFVTGPGSASGIPTPLQSVETGASTVVTAQYWGAVGNTLVTALIGFVLAVLVGVPLGLINGTYRKVEQSTLFVIDFGRTIPGVAVLPLVLLLFGGTRTMAVVLVIFSAVWPILVQSSYAAQQLSYQMKQVARAFRLSTGTRIRDIYLPSAMPFLMTGLRISATISLLITISAEFLGGADGLGQRLYQALIVDDTRRMFVYVVTAGVLGILLNRVLVLTQSRVLWWHPSERVKKP